MAPATAKAAERRLSHSPDPTITASYSVSGNEAAITTFCDRQWKFKLARIAKVPDLLGCAAFLAVCNKSQGRSQAGYKDKRVHIECFAQIRDTSRDRNNWK